MSKIHLIMPMGGAGSRFYRNGYMIPKPLIQMNGKPFLYWAAASVTGSVDVEDITFVVLKRHVDDFGIDAEISKYFPQAGIKIIPEVLPGPVFTCLKGLEDVTDDLPVIFNDCDHMFGCNALFEQLKRGMQEDGALITFESTKPCYSYVRYDAAGNIEGTVEKKAVSTRAICGAYVFKNAGLFRRSVDFYVKNCSYDECFISGVYNVLCGNGGIIKDYMTDFHVGFGTPEEYEEAKTSAHFRHFI